MSKNSFSERVPIFGEVNITLNRESKVVFEKFKKDIKRLDDINQLGVLHNFLKIPPYTRHDYILILLHLIGKSFGSNNEYKNSVKIFKTEFSSLEDLLKSWALIYSLGHFQMTFAAEHAFLKVIISDETKLIEFKKEIEDFFENSELFKESLKNDRKVDNSKLKEILLSIVTEQKIMEVYKIFTLFAIENSLKTFEDKDKEKIKELTKLMIFREKYLEHLGINFSEFDLDRKIKLQKVLKYFEVIRLLTFTILDGSISQRYLNLNYMLILENLDNFMKNKDYQTLLKDINKFYTADIYDSPESAYYHHRCVYQIAVVFKETKISNILNISDFDDKIKKAVKGAEKDISKLRESKVANGNYIQKELYKHIRILIPDNQIKNPVEIESKIFGMNQEKLFGGIIHNQPIKSFEIDLYPNSQFSNSHRCVHTILNAINPIYDQLIENELEYMGLYEKLEFSGDSKELLEKNVGILVKERFINFLSFFKDFCIYLMDIIFEPDVKFTSWDLNDHAIHFPIIFKGKELKKVIKLLEDNYQEKENIEFVKNIDILKEELKDSKSSDLYLYAPNSEFVVNDKIETEIDCLLIKFDIDENKMVSKLGEIKISNDSFNEEQSLKQLKMGFRASKSEGKYLYSSTRKNKNNESNFEVKFKGSESDNLLFFERFENI